MSEAEVWGRVILHPSFGRALSNSDAWLLLEQRSDIRRMLVDAAIEPLVVCGPTGFLAKFSDRSSLLVADNKVVCLLGERSPKKVQR